MLLHNCISHFHNHNLLQPSATFLRNASPQQHIRTSVIDCRSADYKSLGTGIADSKLDFCTSAIVSWIWIQIL
jgi:hypothetical protein